MAYFANENHKDYEPSKWNISQFCESDKVMLIDNKLNEKKI